MSDHYVNISVEHCAEVWLHVAAVLFNIVPQLFDIVAACIFISTALEPWIAVIVFITLGSYIPVTIILTERRVRFRRQVVLLSRFCSVCALGRSTICCLACYVACMLSWEIKGSRHL